jgi:hypothetical protein
VKYSWHDAKLYRGQIFRGLSLRQHCHKKNEGACEQHPRYISLPANNQLEAATVQVEGLIPIVFSLYKKQSSQKLV